MTKMNQAVTVHTFKSPHSEGRGRWTHLCEFEVSQPSLESEFGDSQGYTEKLCLKNQKKNDQTVLSYQKHNSRKF